MGICTRARPEHVRWRGCCWRDWDSVCSIPARDPIPENLGPAAAPFLIVYLDPAFGDVIENVIYASEANGAQWRFESALRDRFA
jgi:hypothetical protein